jgi:hypothetical protein
MNLLQLLELTYLQGGFTTRSDTARFNAELVAEGAAKGYLTTETPRGDFQSVWRITAPGVMYLTEMVLWGDVVA